MDVYLPPNFFDENGNYNKQRVIDLINRAKAGENVPGVKFFDGTKLVDQIKANNSSNSTEDKKSPSMLTLGLVGILIFVVLKKRPKKRDS